MTKQYEIPDVDLDVREREEVLKLFPKAVIASQIAANKRMAPHNTGTYFQRVPVDPISSFCSFPYDIAEDFGYYKIDFIPYKIYDDVLDEEHLLELVNFAESDDFPWEWFQNPIFFSGENTQYQVTQLNRNFKLCKHYPPQSVMDVAILNALIRPRKKYLVGEDWEFIKEVVWQKLPEEETGNKGTYFFKKSHAVAFAIAILVHMQLIAEYYDITK